MVTQQSLTTSNKIISGRISCILIRCQSNKHISLPNSTPMPISVQSSSVLPTSIEPQHAENDSRIKGMMADLKSDVVKYTLAAQLPSFVLTLQSKITGGELLTDRYANRIFQKGSALASELIKTGGGPYLEGQSDAFFQHLNQAVATMGKQFLAGYIANSGWQHVDNYVESLLSQQLGKGVFAFAIKALGTRVVQNVKIDIEKQLQAYSSEPNYLVKTAEIARDAATTLIMAYDSTPLIRTDNIDEKEALAESLRAAALHTLHSSALPQMLARFIRSQLTTEQVPHLAQMVNALSATPGINPAQKNFISGLLRNLLTQLQNEFTPVPASLPSATTPVTNGELAGELKTIAKQFLRNYLGNSQWKLADNYVNTSLSRLPPKLQPALQPLLKQIWAGIKPDILAYAHAPEKTDNAVDQLITLGQQFARGYIGQFGWNAADTFARQQLEARFASDSAMYAVAEKLWQHGKTELEQLLAIDQQAPENATFMTDTLLTGGQLVSQLLGKPKVAATAMQAIRQFGGKQVDQEVTEADPQQDTPLNTVGDLLEQLFADNNTGSAPGWFSLAGAVRWGARITKQGGLGLLRTYLTGQGFTTLDEYLLQMPGLPPEILAQVWSQVRSQLTDELFGSQAAFDELQQQNGDNAQSVLIDMRLRKAMGLPDDRPQDWMNYGMLLAGAGTNATLATTQAVGKATIEASKVVVEKTIAAVNYLTAAVWSFFGTSNETRNRPDMVNEFTGSETISGSSSEITRERGFDESESRPQLFTGGPIIIEEIPENIPEYAREAGN